MELYSQTATNESGDIVNSASVSVTLSSSGLPATIFDKDGVSLANPFLTGYDRSKGEVEFAAVAGLYDITVAGNPGATKTDQALFDPENETTPGLTAHIADATDAHDATAISNVAAGNIVATTVQAAIDELDGQDTTIRIDLDYLSVATVAAMKLLNVIAGETVITQGYYAAGGGGGATYLVVAPQTFDGYGDHELANSNIATLQLKGESFNGKQYGIKSDASSDDTAARQAAYDRLAANGGSMHEVDGDSLTSSTLTITYTGKPFTITRDSDALIVSSVSGGDFTLDVIGGLFLDLDIGIENNDATGNGMRVRNSNPATATNSLYNKFKGRIQNQGGRSATKPAIGSGSVGVQFDEVNTGSGGSNYFNQLEDGFRVRGYDTGIRCKDNANANRFTNPQLELYWYGIDMDADESFSIGGFCHSAPGIDASNLTDAVYLHANRIYNRIQGLMIEPGGFASPGTIVANAHNNYIDTTDNAPYGWINNGYNNGPVDTYIYTTLTDMNFPSISNGSYASATRTVAGAEIGDETYITASIAIADGVFLKAAVTAADTVKIYAYNMSGGAVNLANFTPWLELIRH